MTRALMILACFVIVPALAENTRPACETSLDRLSPIDAHVLRRALGQVNFEFWHLRADGRDIILVQHQRPGAVVAELNQDSSFRPKDAGALSLPHWATRLGSLTGWMSEKLPQKPNRALISLGWILLFLASEPSTYIGQELWDVPESHIPNADPGVRLFAGMVGGGLVVAGMAGIMKGMGDRGQARAASGSWRKLLAERDDSEHQLMILVAHPSTIPYLLDAREDAGMYLIEHHQPQ